MYCIHKEIWVNLKSACSLKGNEMNAIVLIIHLRKWQRAVMACVPPSLSLWGGHYGCGGTIAHKSLDGWARVLCRCYLELKGTCGIACCEAAFPASLSCLLSPVSCVCCLQKGLQRWRKAQTSWLPSNRSTVWGGNRYSSLKTDPLTATDCLCTELRAEMSLKWGAQGAHGKPSPGARWGPQQYCISEPGQGWLRGCVTSAVTRALCLLLLSWKSSYFHLWMCML